MPDCVEAAARLPAALLAALAEDADETEQQHADHTDNDYQDDLRRGIDVYLCLVAIELSFVVVAEDAPLGSTAFVPGNLGSSCATLQQPSIVILRAFNLTLVPILRLFYSIFLLSTVLSFVVQKPLSCQKWL